MNSREILEANLTQLKFALEIDYDSLFKHRDYLTNYRAVNEDNAWEFAVKFSALPAMQKLRKAIHMTLLTYDALTHDFITYHKPKQDHYLTIETSNVRLELKIESNTLIFARVYYPTERLQFIYTSVIEQT